LLLELLLICVIYFKTLSLNKYFRRKRAARNCTGNQLRNRRKMQDSITKDSTQRLSRVRMASMLSRPSFAQNKFHKYPLSNNSSNFLYYDCILFLKQINVVFKRVIDDLFDLNYCTDFQHLYKICIHFNAYE
jgi:hypothetical protein